MAEKIEGTGARIKFNVHGTHEIYCYATSFSITPTVEYIGVTTQGDGSWKRVKPKRKSYTVQMDALALLSDDAGKVTSTDMLEQMLQFVQLPFEILYTGETGTVLSLSGNVWIQQMTWTATPTGFVSKNVQMIGNGEILRSDVGLSIINLTLQVVSSPGTVTMEDVRIVDSFDNETIVHAGVIANGTSVVVPITGGTYHIRATLNSDRAYNLFYSDANPGFAVPLDGAQTNTEYWPYPPASPIWDFTADRYLKFQGSNTPIS